MSHPQTRTIEHATLLDFQKDLITITTSTALPPGSRVQFNLDVESHLEPVSLLGKVVSIRPSDKGRFTLGIRLHSLTREQSLALSGKAAAS